MTDMMTLEISLAIIALLYSITGHGGASGYIAVMVLLGMAPQEIKPLALILNISVSAVATLLFYRAGYFRWPLFWPFIVASMPCALLGGYSQLPVPWFKALLGITMVFAACRLAIRSYHDHELRAPQVLWAMLSGAVIGVVSGLLGIGGGILLTPLILLLGWAHPKQAAAVSAPFILLNSLSGLLGFSLWMNEPLSYSPLPLVLAVLLGGLAGAYLGSRVLLVQSVARILSAVLFIASFKLFYA